MRQRPFRLLAAAAAVPMLLGVAACSDDGTPGNREEAIDELVEIMTTGEGAIGEEDARCVAETVIDEVGLERVQEGFVDADEIDDPDLEAELSGAMMSAVMDCVDMESLLEEE